MHPPATSIEGNVIVLVQWMKLGIETVGVVLVAIGVCVAIAQLARILAARQHTEFTDIRLTLARYLALALEFELGADILGTAVSPSWDQIGKPRSRGRDPHGTELLPLDGNEAGKDGEVEPAIRRPSPWRSTPQRSPEKRAVFPKQCGARRGGNP